MTNSHERGQLTPQTEFYSFSTPQWFRLRSSHFQQKDTPSPHTPTPPSFKTETKEFQLIGPVLV